MNGYGYNEVFTPPDIHRWRRAGALIDGLGPDRDSKIRCHELARAIHKFMSLGMYAYVVDGKCGLVEHSWIQLKPETILDVYTVGRLPMVQLVHVSVASTIRTAMGPTQLYEPGPRRMDIDTGMVKSLCECFSAIATTGLFR